MRSLADTLVNTWKLLSRDKCIHYFLRAWLRKLPSSQRCLFFKQPPGSTSRKCSVSHTCHNTARVFSRSSAQQRSLRSDSDELRVTMDTEIGHSLYTPGLEQTQALITLLNQEFSIYFKSDQSHGINNRLQWTSEASCFKGSKCYLWTSQVRQAFMWWCM